MNRSSFIIVVLLLFSLSFTYAGERAGPPVLTERTRGEPAVDFSASYGLQYIYYTDTGSNTDKVTSGFGAAANFSIPAKNNKIRLSSGLSAEYYRYKNFHSYLDLKLSESVTYQIFPSETNATHRIYTGVGAGADFVFRSDGDFGIYFLANTSLVYALRLNKHSDFLSGANADITLQKGSWLFHVQASAGIRVWLGE